ncbi:hypothetical protein QAD02_023207 [Eretmocerus hayati]|uniref:Uncharacterized protein n=1 Tax=Eretmocerus hayati TaxID=131215 RepID=A0ACC2PV97_9HYME|nr:hypothetical protein QAD02_023207 [Eretmocerus hayati]
MMEFLIVVRRIFALTMFWVLLQIENTEQLTGTGKNVPIASTPTAQVTPIPPWVDSCGFSSERKSRQLEPLGNIVLQANTTLNFVEPFIFRYIKRAFSCSNLECMSAYQPHKYDWLPKLDEQVPNRLGRQLDKKLLDQIKIQTVLCELQVELKNRQLVPRTNVTRDVMPEDIRALGGRSHEDLRDWLIIRDCMNYLQFVRNSFKDLGSLLAEQKIRKS